MNKVPIYYGCKRYLKGFKEHLHLSQPVPFELACHGHSSLEEPFAAFCIIKTNFKELVQQTSDINKTKESVVTICHLYLVCTQIHIHGIGPGDRIIKYTR